MKDEKPLMPEAPARKWIEPHEVALVEAYSETQSEFWGYVADVLELKTGVKYTAEECATRYARI